MFKIISLFIVYFFEINYLLLILKYFVAKEKKNMRIRHVQYSRYNIKKNVIFVNSYVSVTNIYDIQLKSTSIQRNEFIRNSCSIRRIHGHCHCWSCPHWATTIWRNLAKVDERSRVAWLGYNSVWWWSLKIPSQPNNYTYFTSLNSIWSTEMTNIKD